MGRRTLDLYNAEMVWAWVLGLGDFPVGEQSFLWDRVMVAVVEILHQSQRKVARVRRLLARSVGYYGKVVNRPPWK